MLYASPADRDVYTPVTYADEGLPPALAPALQPPAATPSLPAALDMRRAMAPVETEFYLSGAREEDIYTGAAPRRTGSFDTSQYQDFLRLEPTNTLTKRPLVPVDEVITPPNGTPTPEPPPAPPPLPPPEEGIWEKPIVGGVKFKHAAIGMLAISAIAITIAIVK